MSCFSLLHVNVRSSISRILPGVAVCLKGLICFQLLRSCHLVWQMSALEILFIIIIIIAVL